MDFRTQTNLEFKTISIAKVLKMINKLDAFKAFMTTVATLLALNSDQALRSISVLAFLMTSAGTLYFGVERMLKQWY